MGRCINGTQKSFFSTSFISYHHHFTNLEHEPQNRGRAEKDGSMEFRRLGAHLRWFVIDDLGIVGFPSSLSWSMPASEDGGHQGGGDGCEEYWMFDFSFASL